jgi:SOS-response transcriptional repressor LexA
MSDDFGGRVRARRKALGLKQHEVASALGIDRTTVGYWEKNSSRPGAVTVNALAEVLQVAPEWLLTGKGAAPPPVSRETFTSRSQPSPGVSPANPRLALARCIEVLEPLQEAARRQTLDALTALYSAQDVVPVQISKPQREEAPEAPVMVEIPPEPAEPEAEVEEAAKVLDFPAAPREWRLTGRIAAGGPIEALRTPEHRDGPAEIDQSNHYLLEVRGESMVDAGIADRALVICRKITDWSWKRGDYVCALIDGHEATLKRYVRSKMAGKHRRRVWLAPENPDLEVQEYGPDRKVQIQGKVVAVKNPGKEWRKL